MASGALLAHLYQCQIEKKSQKEREKETKQINKNNQPEKKERKK